MESLLPKMCFRSNLCYLKWKSKFLGQNFEPECTVVFYYTSGYGRMNCKLVFARFRCKWCRWSRKRERKKWSIWIVYKTSFEIPKHVISFAPKVKAVCRIANHKTKIQEKSYEKLRKRVKAALWYLHSV